MTKQEIITNIRKLIARFELMSSDTCVVYDATMVLLGIKETCDKAEVLISTKAWVKLLNRGLKPHHNALFPEINIRDLNIVLRLDPKMFCLEKGMFEGVTILHPRRLLDVLVTNIEERDSGADVESLRRFLIKH